MSESTMWRATYDPETYEINGFFPPDYGGEQPTENYVEITQEEHVELVQVINNKLVTYNPDTGEIEISDHPGPTEEEIAEAERRWAEEEAKNFILEKLIENAVQTLDFTADELTTLVTAEMVPVWEEGASYEAGTRVVYDGQVYTVTEAVAMAAEPPISSDIYSNLQLEVTLESGSAAVEAD